MICLREEHHQVRETARQFADEVLAPRARDFDEKEEFPTDVVRFDGRRWHSLGGALGVDGTVRAFATFQG